MHQSLNEYIYIVHVYLIAVAHIYYFKCFDITTLPSQEHGDGAEWAWASSHHHQRCVAHTNTHINNVDRSRPAFNAVSLITLNFDVAQARCRDVANMCVLVCCFAVVWGGLHRIACQLSSEYTLYIACCMCISEHAFTHNWVKMLTRLFNLSATYIREHWYLVIQRGIHNTQ